MKYLSTVVKVSLFFLIMTAMGCATTGKTNGSDSNNQKEEQLSIRERLNQKPAITVNGRYSNMRVSIRGEGSVTNPGQQPLIVVDGQKMGRNFYNNVVSKFNSDQIVSIKVLSGSGANMYGGEGGQGVIVFKTNR